MELTGSVPVQNKQNPVCYEFSSERLHWGFGHNVHETFAITPKWMPPPRASKFISLFWEHTPNVEYQILHNETMQNEDNSASNPLGNMENTTLSQSQPENESLNLAYMKFDVVDELKNYLNDSPSMYRIVKHLNKENIIAFVASSENEQIALIYGENQKSNRLYIAYIHEERNIRNKGIGLNLLKKIEEVARAKMYKEMFLYVSKTNNKAGNLYLRNGYEVRDVRNNSTWVPKSSE